MNRRGLLDHPVKINLYRRELAKPHPFFDGKHNLLRTSYCKCRDDNLPATPKNLTEHAIKPLLCIGP